MSITLYGTEELILVQQRVPNLPDGFWRDKFPRVVTSDREEILFERLDIDNRRLAPFVAPNVQGRVMRKQGFSARSFKPAYVKPKHIVDPSKAISRMFGEPLLGGMSMAQRFDAHVAQNMRLEREMIERRWDWLACQALKDGMVTIAGDDYPLVTVDFLRDPSLTAALTGAARWTETTADPLSDLETLADDAFILGNAPITDLIFGTTAWKLFLKNAQVLFLLNQFYRGSTSDFQRSTIGLQSNFQAMGEIGGTAGSFRLWRYSNWYSDTDSNGKLTRKEFIDPDTVIGIGNAFDGIACFGAIMDVDANFLAEASIFPKMWKEDDPSVVYTMSQSAPLYVPTNPNNTFKLKVTAAA
jgi:hypothetical protein